MKNHNFNVREDVIQALEYYHSGNDFTFNVGVMLKPQTFILIRTSFKNKRNDVCEDVIKTLKCYNFGNDFETSASAHADTFKILVAAWERTENGLGHLLRRHEGFGGFLRGSWKLLATSWDCQKWIWDALEDNDLAILR